MEEYAFQFIPQVKFLSLIKADITHLPDEHQYYFNNVVQRVFHCFGCSEARIVLELDHLIDFMLKDDKIIHEERPEGKIVGGNVYEFTIPESETKAIEAAPAVVEELAIVEASVEVVEEAPSTDVPESAE